MTTAGTYPPTKLTVFLAAILVFNHFFEQNLRIARKDNSKR